MTQTHLITEHKSTNPALWDRVGIGASALCLVHCLLTSVLLAALPLLNLSVLHNERIHQILAVFIVGVGGLAFFPGYRRHRRPLPLLLGAAGLALLLSAAFAVGPALGHAWETPLTIAGGALMVCAHYLNLRLARQCEACGIEHD
jgi:hypothetical protein